MVSTNTAPTQEISDRWDKMRKRGKEVTSGTHIRFPTNAALCCRRRLGLFWLLVSRKFQPARLPIRTSSKVMRPASRSKKRSGARSAHVHRCHLHRDLSAEPGSPKAGDGTSRRCRRGGIWPLCLGPSDLQVTQERQRAEPGSTRRGKQLA